MRAHDFSRWCADEEIKNGGVEFQHAIIIYTSVGSGHSCPRGAGSEKKVPHFFLFLQSTFFTRPKIFGPVFCFFCKLGMVTFWSFLDPFFDRFGPLLTSIEWLNRFWHQFSHRLTPNITENGVKKCHFFTLFDRFDDYQLFESVFDPFFDQKKSLFGSIKNIFFVKNILLFLKYFFSFKNFFFIASLKIFFYFYVLKIFFYNLKFFFVI